MVCVPGADNLSATITLGTGTVSLQAVVTPTATGSQICYTITNNSDISFAGIFIEVCPSSPTCTVPPLPALISITSKAVAPCIEIGLQTSYPTAAVAVITACGMGTIFTDPTNPGVEVPRPPNACTTICIEMNAPTPVVRWLLGTALGQQLRGLHDHRVRLPIWSHHNEHNDDYLDLYYLNYYIDLKHKGEFRPAAPVGHMA